MCRMKNANNLHSLRPITNCHTLDKIAAYFCSLKLNNNIAILVVNFVIHEMHRKRRKCINTAKYRNNVFTIDFDVSQLKIFPSVGWFCNQFDVCQSASGSY